MKQYSVLYVPPINIIRLSWPLPWPWPWLFNVRGFLQVYSARITCRIHRVLPCVPTTTTGPSSLNHSLPIILSPGHQATNHEPEALRTQANMIGQPSSIFPRQENSRQISGHTSFENQGPPAFFSLA